jgi:long-chain acyl-CoA synthetase
MHATPTVKTLNELFLRLADSNASVSFLVQDAQDIWQPVSAMQLYQRVRSLALCLLDWDIVKGDRVAIISETRHEWAIADFAITAIGGVDVPIYPTLTGPQMASILRDSGSRVAIVSSQQLYDKLATVRESTPLERVILMDCDQAPDGAVSFAEIIGDADKRGAERDHVFDALARTAMPDDLATLIYTSGTTGEPKGVMLTHGNLAHNICFATVGFNFTPEDYCISVLPLSHITARMLDYCMMYDGSKVAYCTQFEKMPAAMQQVRPTIIVGVPRMYEKIRQEVERRAGLSAVRARILHSAVGFGRKYRDTVYNGRKPKSALWKLAYKVVYSKIHAAFGGRARVFVSGGAPLGVDTATWYASVGIQVLEGYGLTETSPVIAINNPLVHRMGAVGKPLNIAECKLAEDGELLVRGPSVFKGYWNKPEANAECFKDGWFLTGDIGAIDSDGFLYITDRKKELLKTSGGKFIAPQPIENRIKANVLVGQAALVGDKRKFISVILSPNYAALEQWAEHHHVHVASRAELLKDARVIAQYESIIRQVNADLASFETVKRFRIVPEEWSIDGGELTPSLKLKRRVITSRYAALIDEIYADEATSRGE